MASFHAVGAEADERAREHRDRLEEEKKTGDCLVTAREKQKGGHRDAPPAMSHGRIFVG